MNLSQDRHTAGNAIEWLSRTIAVLVLMGLPGGIGVLLDNQLETKYLMPTGVIVGFVLGTAMLIFLAVKFTPKAGGEPLPIDDAAEEPDNLNTPDHQKRNGEAT
ncbi:MAG: hypothetical protein ACE361_08370 [Aureliella sp.]